MANRNCFLGFLVAALLCNGCASTSKPAVEIVSTGKTSAPMACDQEKDREAIRKLAGEFWVDFHFEETIPLRDGYKLAPAYETAGRELVVVVEDNPTRIVLQHILVVPTADKPKAIKHWREDWQFEDADLLEFRGKRLWERRQVNRTEVTCHWSQAVFEVDDAPRYEALGRWQHGAGNSTWTSNTTWRPLPRREYTKRSDYDVLVGVNRITVTPEGWAHEQDNEKLALTERRESLVREIGINRYIRSPDESLAAASAYWQQTRAYWQLVREEWARAASGERLEVMREVDGRPQHEKLLQLAEAPPTQDARTQIRQAIQKALVAVPAN